MAIGFAKAIKEAGAEAEMECFDTGHLHSYGVLEDMGLIDRPCHFSFIMGVLGGIPATARGALVDAAAAMVELSGRAVATVAEARALLWPDGGGNV